MESKLIIPEDHFRPLVFVDMAVSAKVACIGVATVGKSIEKDYNDGKKKFSSVSAIGLEKIKFSSNTVSELINSISDIKM